MKTINAKFQIKMEQIKLRDTIPPSAFHSLNGGVTLMPIINNSTVGDKPISFGKQRSFWKIVQITKIPE